MKGQFHKKIIAFSYFDPKNTDPYNRHYFDGIAKNLKGIQKFYPGWIMRLYYQIDQNSRNMESLCKLGKYNNSVTKTEIFL